MGFGTSVLHAKPKKAPCPSGRCQTHGSELSCVDGMMFFLFVSLSKSRRITLARELSREGVGARGLL